MVTFSFKRRPAKETHPISDVMVRASVADLYQPENEGNIQDCRTEVMTMLCCSVSQG